MVLASLQPQLQRLLMLQTLQPGYLSTGSISQSRLQDLVPGAPSSWTLGQRASSTVDSVSVRFIVCVSDIRNNLQRCAEKRVSTSTAIAITTPPLGGVGFSVKLKCTWKSDLGGPVFGLFVYPRDMPSNAPCAFTGKLAAGGIDLKITKLRPACGGNRSVGKLDFFDLGAMAGGWDEAAKGLPPVTEQLDLRLTITSVGHANITLATRA